MVSERNKDRLRSALKKSAGAVRRAGEAYWDYSGRAAERMKSRAEREADEAAEEAERVARNGEPNDMEDDEMYRMVIENQRETHRLLRGIRDELQAPPDRDMGVGLDTGFGSGGAGFGSGGDFDWTEEL